MLLILYKKIIEDLRDYFFGTNLFGFCGDLDERLYPIDLEFTLQDKKNYYTPMDKDGIPIKKYISVGEQYNPTRIAAYGLANYNRWILDGDFSARNEFLKMANWFFENKSGRYEYHFDWGTLKNPWISCMAQGEAVSVLVRAFTLTNDSRYIEKARLALEPFLNNITSGGVQSYIGDAWLYLEEYPVEKPEHVLNGFMYALIGLSEYSDLKPDDEEICCLRDKLIQTLLHHIERWSFGNWSLYQVSNSKNEINTCTPKYHNLQISQLTYIMRKFNLKSLDVVVSRWKNGADSFLYRMFALLYKIYFRLKIKAQR
ncbi:D-glucuronyl C5-epimerase family protein [uncultured Endozoicomonas sp.]|uniref:D-glucuronyl C5-epimerase family protein n=1 Tax=uncultured Endozoicomonas sp. TaxID=432652 RepID=UPI002612BB92|nr:D-glucuronyl C5-epimerase family protein [uncultured Endozoicomonas sp.]